MSFKKDYTVKPISLVRRGHDAVKLSRVKPLVKLSASVIAKLFIDKGLHTEDRKSKNYAPLESYFCTLPLILREAVGTEIQQSLNLEQDAAFTLMPDYWSSKQANQNLSFLSWRIFFAQSKTLNLSEMFSEGSGCNEIMHFILESQEDDFNQFSKLVLSSCEISSTNLSYTYEVTDSTWKPQLDTLFHKLTNITHLILKYFCDDDTLVMVGKKCSKIQYLEIQLLPETMKDQQLTDDGFEEFIQYQLRNPTLKEVNLKECYSSSVTSRSTISLSEIPSLRSMRVRSFHLSWISLQICNSKRDTFPASTTLKHLAINFFSNGTEVMDTHKNCFDVVPEPRFVQFLLELIPLIFNKLERIDLDGIHGDLLPFRDETFRFLKNVITMRIKKMPRILDLSSGLPRLQELELYYVPFAQNDDGSARTFTPIFQSLRKLTIYKDSFRHSILLSDLEELLNAAPSLKELKICQLTIKAEQSGELGNITEDEFINLFRSIPHLKNITNLYLVLNDGHCLTERTLMFLLEYCHNLEKLENLLYWNISFHTLDKQCLFRLGYSVTYGSRYHWGLHWKGDDATVHDPEVPVDRF